MTSTIYDVPFPELDQKRQEQEVRDAYAKIQEREQAEAEQREADELARIDRESDAAALLRDMALRVKYVRQYGSSRFAEINAARLRNDKAQREVQREAERLSRSKINTTAGRIAELNKGRAFSAK